MCISIPSSSSRINAGTAEPFRVSPPEAVAYPLELWRLRWSLLKKPSNLSVEEKQAIAELESEDEGFVHRFAILSGNW